MTATTPFTRQEKYNLLFALPALLGVALTVIYAGLLGFLAFVMSGLFIVCLQLSLLFVVAVVGVYIFLSGYRRR